MDNDDRWRPHPKARPGRQYGSLVSIPVRRGDEVVGVLNVISTHKNAFTQGDLNYIELLAALINLAHSLSADAGRADEEGEEDES